MKPGHTFLAILIIASAAAKAQVVSAPGSSAPNAPATVSPAKTGPAGLPVGGTLHYDLRYSESTQFGGVQDGEQWSIFTGDASYANTAKRLPFSMQYGGGYGLSWNGPPSAGNVFQHLSLSQGIVWRSWNLNASDNVSYSFETPTTGFTGVPGTGEPIGGTGSTTLTDQTILTQNTRSLDNVTTIAAGHRLDHATSLSFGGSWGTMIFIDNNGGNDDTLAANASLSRRLDAHNSISGQYSFSRFNYSGVNSASQAKTPQTTFSQTNSAQISFSRQWNPKISTSASVGPQWLSNSESATIPTTTSFTMSVSASDTFKIGTGNVNYNHGANGGAGYFLGAKIDSVNASFSRGFGKNLNVGVTGSYMRTASLIAAELEYACIIDKVTYLCLVPLNYTPVTSARYGGAQATWKLGRYLSTFASYTAINQSSNLQLSTPNSPLTYNANILNGLNQVISFGIGYTPREAHLKR